MLAHDPDDRWQSAGDVRRERSGPRHSRPTRNLVHGAHERRCGGDRSGRDWIGPRRRMEPVARAHDRRDASARRQPESAARWGVSPGRRHGDFADGLQLAFIAHTGGANRVWIRALDSPAIRELAGTDGAALPFWSPDGKSIGFFALGKLKRLDLSGGAPRVLCDVTSGRGGAWGADNTMTFNAYNDGPLLRVSASGGAPLPLTTLDQTKGENSHRWPEFLPDGRRFLYLARAKALEDWGVYVSSIDNPSDKTLVLRSLTSPSYARRDARTGYLLWTRADEPVAQPFDARPPPN